MTKQSYMNFLDRFVKDKQLKNSEYSYKQGKIDASPYFRANCRGVSTSDCPSRKKCKLTKMSDLRKSYCRRSKNSYKFNDGQGPFDFGQLPSRRKKSKKTTMPAGILSGLFSTPKPKKVTSTRRKCLVYE